MKNSILNIWLIEIISALLILLFVYTGVSKILEHNVFSIQLFKVPILGKYREIVSWLLPLLELVVALLLVFKATRLKALYISFAMLIVFTLYLTGMLLFSKDLPCKCGGVINQMTWEQHVFFNLFFITITWAGIMLERRNQFHNLKNISPMA